MLIYLTQCYVHNIYIDSEALEFKAFREVKRLTKHRFKLLKIYGKIPYDYYKIPVISKDEAEKAFKIRNDEDLCTRVYSAMLKKFVALSDTELEWLESGEVVGGILKSKLIEAVLNNNKLITNVDSNSTLCNNLVCSGLPRVVDYELHKKEYILEEKPWLWKKMINKHKIKIKKQGGIKQFWDNYIDAQFK